MGSISGRNLTISGSTRASSARSGVIVLKLAHGEVSAPRPNADAISRNCRRGSPRLFIVGSPSSPVAVRKSGTALRRTEPR